MVGIMSLFVTVVFLFFFVRTFKHSEVTYDDGNRRYRYWVDIFLVNGEKHQIIVFSDSIYKNVTELLERGNILIDFNKKLVFNEEGYTKEVLMKDVLVMQMRSEVQ